VRDVTLSAGIAAGENLIELCMTIANPHRVKVAATDVEVHPYVAERWSPRGFDPKHTLAGDQLASLVEAARWAPSAGNSQPWHYIVTTRGDEAHAKVYAALASGNRSWAGNASALLVAIAESHEDDERGLGTWAAYDLGQSVAWLTMQAHHLGLSVHQMGGFDGDALRRAFDIPAKATPYAVIAVGVRTREHDLPEHYAAIEDAPRRRKPRESFVHGRSWGEPHVS
jgi:nitroreductase